MHASIFLGQQQNWENNKAFNGTGWSRICHLVRSVILRSVHYLELILTNNQSLITLLGGRIAQLVSHLPLMLRPRFESWWGHDSGLTNAWMRGEEIPAVKVIVHQFILKKTTKKNNNNMYHICNIHMWHI